jgi:16S rRNA (cytosine1402-N4)-methyltransferase
VTDETNAPQGGGHGTEFGHVPVLLEPAIDFLNVRRGGSYLDATTGLAGHSFAIAKLLGAQGHLIGFDKDPNALEQARRRLNEPPAELKQDWPAITLVHASFAEVGERIEVASLDGLIADLGVSSLQLGNPARGFSFQAEGPLDMRMNPDAGQTAEQVVNRIDERTLADVIYEFGEERRSRRIARAICRARPIHTTRQLAEVIAAAARPMKSHGSERIHPATRTFQALRIFVNRELDDIKALLKDAPRVLRKGGRLVVISFHSLEDRLVKDALREGSHPNKRYALGGGPETLAVWQVLTKKPVTADEEEIERNPRSRSAKLRAAEKL